MYLSLFFLLFCFLLPASGEVKMHDIIAIF